MCLVLCIWDFRNHKNIHSQFIITNCSFHHQLVIITCSSLFSTLLFYELYKFTSCFKMYNISLKNCLRIQIIIWHKVEIVPDEYIDLSHPFSLQVKCKDLDSLSELWSYFAWSCLCAYHKVWTF